MANVVILRGERSVRLPYWRLQDAFEVLDVRLPLDDPARRLMDPWLAHIRAQLGYVNFNDDLLEDRAGTRRLREVLVPLANELESDELPPPPRTLAKGWTEYETKFTLDACRRLVAFLDEVIADQDAEDAGAKPPLATAS